MDDLVTVLIAEHRRALVADVIGELRVDGEAVAAAGEERFSRRKHGKRPVPFSR